MTTFTAYANALAALSVAGVNRFTSPPQALHTADLPASWPMMPSGGDGTMVFASGQVSGGNVSLVCDLIFALEPVGQNTAPANYAALLALLDAVIAASNTMSRPCRGPVTYTIRAAIVQVGGTDYWALVQTWNGVG